MSNVSANCHTQAAGKGFEDAFYLMVLVLAFCLDIEVDGCAVGEALEKVQEHLGWHLAYFLTMELRIPYEPRTPPKVKSDLT